jgi:hypothetical protein
MEIPITLTKDVSGQPETFAYSDNAEASFNLSDTKTAAVMECPQPDTDISSNEALNGASEL